MAQLGVPPTASHNPAYPVLSFITFHDPNEAKRPSQKTAVKSHAASYGNRLDNSPQLSQGHLISNSHMLGFYGTSRTTPTGRKKRRKRKDTDIVLDTDALQRQRVEPFN